jgi:hypothetical protein
MLVYQRVSKVLIFCENKSDVDDVHEYLLLKAVEAGENSASFLRTKTAALANYRSWLEHARTKLIQNHLGVFYEKKRFSIQWFTPFLSFYISINA